MTMDAREQHERQSMRAVGFRRYGPPDELEALELLRPEPGPGEILIRVAAAVNPADWALRSGRLRPSCGSSCRPYPAQMWPASLRQAVLG